MANDSRPECCVDVPLESPRVGFYQCSRKGALQRDDKWYCKQHDPVAVKKRAAASAAKYDAEWKQKRKQWDRRYAERLACEGVPTDQLTEGLVAYLLGGERDNADIQG